MKILVINTAKRGGREKCAYHLCKNLDNKRDTFEIVYPKRVDNYSNWEKIECEKHFVLDFHSTRLSSQLKVISRLRQLSKCNFDKVIFTATHPLTPLYMTIFRREDVAVIIHDPIIGFDEKMFDRNIVKSIYFYFANSIIDKYSNNITLLSEKFVTIYKERYPNKNINHIKHGIFDEFNREVKEKVYDVCFAGRITKYKGLSYLLSAIEGSDRNISLVVAGSGDIADINYFTNNENAHLFNCWLSDEEMCDIIAKSRLVVLPYLSASQSGIITLANACTVPVITTNIGGLPEQVDHMIDGILVSPANTESLRDAIEKVLDDNSLYEKFLGNSAIRREDLSWSKITQHYIEYLRGL